MRISICLWFIPVFASGQKGEKDLYSPEHVNRFYQIAPAYSWFAPQDSSRLLRAQLLREIDTAFYYGQLKQKYHYTGLQPWIEKEPADSLLLAKTEYLFTDAALALSRDLFTGKGVKPPLLFDALTKTLADTTEKYLVAQLSQVSGPEQLHQVLASYEPADSAFRLLKQEWVLQTNKKPAKNARLIEYSLGLYRWLNHFRFDKYILVNLTEARLYYFEKDSLVLQMKTVVGKQSTPSPRFAAWCPEIILYPYWYVPSSIVFEEYLPLIRANTGWLDAHNMQIVDGYGRVINHHQLNWAKLGPGNFPYTMRQSTGCDNALGVIKFNIQTPFGVYLHDTNRRTAFLSGARYYSHGCIRLEEPIALGNRLLANRLDTNFLQSCFRDQKPVPLQLDAPVPVIAAYIPVTVDRAGKVKYHKDVYQLLK